LFQELTNLFSAVIVSEKINQKIQEMIDIHETIEVQDLPLDENLVEIILDLVNHEMINF
jgi:hypothetical protein